MRKRERDEVAVTARRRLDALAAELSDLVPESGGWSQQPRVQRRDQPREVAEEHPDAQRSGRPQPAPFRSDRPPGPARLRGSAQPTVPPLRHPSGHLSGHRPGHPAPHHDPLPGPAQPVRPPADPRIPQPRAPHDPSVQPPWPGPDTPHDPDDPDDPGDPDDEPTSADSFLGWAAPVLAGPPGALLGHDALVHHPVGRALPPDPARVPPPGRHAVAHPGVSVGQWFEERLPRAVRGRLALSGQHLAVLTGLLGVALALAGWLALRDGSAQESVPQARFVSQQADSSSPAPSSAPGSGASSSTARAVGAASGAPSGAPAGDVVVDVVGKVRRPGIVTLPTGSRVNDAVRRAGGVRVGVHTDALNLARVLVDGEQIVVGQAPAAAAAAAAAPGAGAASGAGAAPAAAGALVNLNTAGLAELDTLPGVGPVTAQKILDWRTAHGAFSAVDELLEVDGIGDKTLADIAPRATL